MAPFERSSDGGFL